MQSYPGELLVKPIRLLWVAALSAMMLSALAALWPRASVSAPVTRFAKSGGSGGACTQSAPCTLQTALNQSNHGDTIYLGGGAYTGSGGAVVTLTKSVALLGGWNGAPSGAVVRNPAAYPSTLDGQSQRRVIYIGGDITPTLDGLVIARGNASGFTTYCANSGGGADGCGGGIYVLNAHPLILNNVITNNLAALATLGYPTGTTGYGGGLFLYNAQNAVISGNLIISNAASVVYCGLGGGLLLYADSTGVVVQNNQVIGNYATTTSDSCAWGGGIGLSDMTGATVRNNQITGNWANQLGNGYGAGLYEWYGRADVIGNRIQANHGAHAAHLGFSNSHFEANWVTNNSTSIGIALVNGLASGPTLINNTVGNSGATALTASGYSGGPLNAHLLHNTLAGSGAGTGVLIESSFVTMYLTNTIISGFNVGISNTFPASSTVVSRRSLFSNTTNYGSGVTSLSGLIGDPRLGSSAEGEYHIGAGSTAIDAAVGFEVATDIDGSPRPFGLKSDVGADEHGYDVFLPAILK